MTTIHTATITTLAELERFCEDVREQMDAQGRAVVGTRSPVLIGEITYFHGPQKFRLVKEALSDGSAVFNIVAEAHPRNDETVADEKRAERDAEALRNFRRFGFRGATEDEREAEYEAFLHRPSRA